MRRALNPQVAGVTIHRSAGQMAAAGFVPPPLFPEANMIRFCSVVATVATVMTCTSVSAQGKKLAPGDTLHFVQSTRIVQDVDAGAQGQMNITNTMDMNIAMKIGQGDTITLWIEKASTHMDSPMGAMDPDVSSILNKPMVMVINGDGRSTVITEMALPDDPTGLQALAPTTNRYGFTLRHPMDIHVGSTWTDTTTTAPKPGAKQQMTDTTVVTYKVVGDSTINGWHVLTLDGTSLANQHVTMSVDPMTMAMVSKVTTTSHSYYSPDLHIVIQQSSKGNGNATQHIEGPMTLDTSSKQVIETTMKILPGKQ